MSFERYIDVTEATPTLREVEDIALTSPLVCLVLSEAQSQDVFVVSSWLSL